MGRIVSSPIWGGWSVAAGYKLPLIAALSTAALGALVYADVAGAKTGLFALGLAQACIGFGAGSLGVTRARGSRPARRARRARRRWRGSRRCSTPASPSRPSSARSSRCCSATGPTRSARSSSTASRRPALFLFGAFVVGVLMLATMLDEAAPDDARPPAEPSRAAAARARRRRSSTRRRASPSAARAARARRSSSPGSLNLLTRGVIGAFETLTTQLAPQFGISATDAGMIVSLCGTVGVVQLLYFKALYSSRWSIRTSSSPG